MSTAHDHVSLTLPLTGSRLIEASAGTGKTHTLVLLLLRAIVVDGREPRELVAVTYTRAAAGELRERTRSALAAAARRAARPDAAVPAHLAEPIDALIMMALQRNGASTRAELARRVRGAEMAIDSLWLGTLHGFCQRLLSEFGPILGVPGVADDIDAGNALFDMACADAWRALQADATVTTAMAGRLATPDAVAATLREIVVLPGVALVPSAAPDPASLARCQAEYAAAWDNARDAAQTFAELAAMIADRDRHRMSVARNGLSDEALAEIGSQLVDFFWHAPGSRDLPDILKRLTTPSMEVFQNQSYRKKGGVLPDHPLMSALDALFEAERALHADANVALVHRLHADVRERLSRMGFEQGRTRYDELIDRVAALLDSEESASLLIALARSRWQLALIDEFQDTDAVQHAIFAALFGDRLIMVGDPKQAIYRFRGGDVHAYQRASDRADSLDRLGESYRAEQPVVDAVNALFDPVRVADAFVEEFIRYVPVRCSYDVSRHGTLKIDGEADGAGMCVWPVRPSDGGAWSGKEKAGHQVVADVASLIVHLLDDAGSAEYVLPDGGSRRVAASDIAVLCLTNHECANVANALRTRRVPVSLGVDPDVEAAAAEDMRRLLAAWLAPNDSGRLRALALSGFYGQNLAQLSDGSGASPLTPAQLSAFAEQAQRAAAGDVGLALMQAIRSGAAFARRDASGEARVGAWLDLADRLVAWSGPGRGLNELDLELRRWIAGQGDDTGVIRRPESSDAVQVMTVHASKGLEFGIVFAPFLWAQGDPAARRRKQAVPVVRFHDESGRLRADIGSDEFAANASRADEEDRAEAVRKAYVAVTRTRHRLYVPVAVTKKGWADSPLARLLPGVDASTGRGLDEALQSLIDSAPGAITIGVPPVGEPRLVSRSIEDIKTLPTARTTVLPPDDFRLLSYSRLVRRLVDAPKDYEQSPQIDAALEEAAGDAAWLPRGAAFGTCFHALMECVDPAAPDQQLMARIASNHGFGGVRELAYLERLAVATWRADLPGEIAIERIDSGDRAIEMEFFFPVDGFSATALGRVLDTHEAYRRPPERWPASQTAARGYMRGFIDLIYRADGRYYVLDYKTNDLGGNIGRYRDAELVQAIRDHDYDIQYLIYLVALQRLLRTRLGSDYDYDRCVGGAVYLFVRGLEGGAGVHHDRPSRELIDALEHVLCGSRA